MNAGTNFGPQTNDFPSGLRSNQSYKGTMFGRVRLTPKSCHGRCQPARQLRARNASRIAMVSCSIDRRCQREVPKIVMGGNGACRRATSSFKHEASSRTVRNDVEGIMKLPRRQFLHLVAGAAALPAVSRIASAQIYPARPVHIIVGYAPGGPRRAQFFT